MTVQQSAKVRPGSPNACGARGSGPACTESNSATSATFRAIGPPTEVVSQLVQHRPLRYPAQRGTQPDHAAERRRIPQRATHVRAVGHRNHARRQRTAAPPLEPPAERVGSIGL